MKFVFQLGNFGKKRQQCLKFLWFHSRRCAKQRIPLFSQLSFIGEVLGAAFLGLLFLVLQRVMLNGNTLKALMCLLCLLPKIFYPLFQIVQLKLKLFGCCAFRKFRLKIYGVFLV